MGFRTRVLHFHYLACWIGSDRLGPGDFYVWMLPMSSKYLLSTQFFSKQNLIPWCNNYVIMSSNDIRCCLEKFLVPSLNIPEHTYWGMRIFFVELHIYDVCILITKSCIFLIRKILKQPRSPSGSVISVRYIPKTSRLSVFPPLFTSTLDSRVLF